MAKVNKKLSEETGELIEELSAEDMTEEPRTVREGMDLNKKQSIEELTCGRIKRTV